MKKEEIEKSEHISSSKEESRVDNKKTDAAEKNNFPGYPHYPPSEDIYNQEKELDMDIEDNGKVKSRVLPGEANEKSFLDDMTAEDLDVPGSEADEKKNNAGQEDEENNYYSLGGDNHNDLEEDNG